MDSMNNIDESMIDSIVEEALVGTAEAETGPVERIKPNPVYVDTSVSRFTSAEWFEKMKLQNITIAGLGGIGSYVAFLISRLQPSSLELYDDDVVEIENLSGQLYRINSVTKSKVSCTTENIRDFSTFYQYISHCSKFTLHSGCNKILLCGFDNMAARNTAYRRWSEFVYHLPEEEKKECLFVDGRLAAEEFQVFCMTGEDGYLRSVYERDWLFDDSQAEATICSYKQTSFCANMIASIMVNLVVNFVTNLCDPVIKRELPFKTVYDSCLMRLNTQM